MRSLKLNKLSLIYRVEEQPKVKAGPCCDHVGRAIGMLLPWELILCSGASRPSVYGKGDLCFWDPESSRGCGFHTR